MVVACFVKEYWPFDKGEEPTIPREMHPGKLSVLVALKACYGDVAPAQNAKVMVVPSWTDNRGSAAALNKLMTTKFLASAVLLELAT